MSEARRPSDIVDEVRAALAQLPAQPGRYELRGAAWQATAVVVEGIAARLSAVHREDAT